MNNPPHIALMVPINNTTMATELVGWLPSGTDCQTLKIPRGQGLLTRETIPAYKAQALALAQTLVGQPIQALAYGCTAASFLSGAQGDAELCAELTQLIGKPVVTTASAMVKALQAQGAQRIGLVTPYHDEVNDQLKRFLADGGIEVVAFDSLRAPNVDALGRITSTEVAQMARQVMTDGCDAMFIACSQLPTFDILQGLSAEFGRPVLSSIQATAQQLRTTLHL
ncbi:aspartate/glutamate racemase family protein [Limnohabitans sp.]|uniref:maleate cis-trans isomerase family protein n=1 Tax=Limnohabitans sp. TaxID=1907725 RepID=UPI0038BA9B61